MSNFVVRGRVVATWLVALVMVVGPLQPAAACLWDYDTLEMERQRFPETLELITGRFLRHSPEYYQWRLKDRQQRLQAEPDHLALYDDLAVAYDKLGQPQRALEVMALKEERSPSLYETYANLGTFYIHAGQYDEGLSYIRRAIEMKPDAHFGREIYQQRLVEYLLTRQQDGRTVLPLSDEQRVGASPSPVGFAKYVTEQHLPGAVHELPEHVVTEELARARKGVLGMMRFGHHGSPILLEALGDLLLAGSDDGKHLAARAYLRAADGVDTPEARQAYRELASGAFSNQDYPWDQMQREFRIELQEADRWWLGVKNDELRWIAAGVDVDQAFWRKYGDPGSLATSASSGLALPVAEATGPTVMGRGWLVLLALMAGLALVLGYFYWRGHSTRVPPANVGSPA